MKVLYNCSFSCSLLAVGLVSLTLSNHFVAAENTITCNNNRRLQENNGATIASPISGADVDLDVADLAEIPSIKFIGIDKEKPMVFSKKTIGGTPSGSDGKSADSWYGEMEGDKLGTATIVRSQDGGVAGSFSDENFVYQMNTMPDGTVTMEATAFDDFEDELDGEFDEDESVTKVIKEDNEKTIGGDGRFLLSSSNKLRGSLSTSNSQVKSVKEDMNHSRRLQAARVDVLVVVTQRSACAEAGRPENSRNCPVGPIQARVRLALAETNAAMANSGMSTRISISSIHIDTSGFDETKGDIRYALQSLGGRNGNLDYVRGMRDSVGADMVSLIIEAPGPCGYGNINGPFSVTKRGCSTGYYSFGHELAHGFGCYHNRASSNSNHPFAHGYQDPNGRFRSIMAYNCPNGGCRREPRYSNTKERFQGRPIGDSNNNCARQIDLRANTVAGWRSAVADCAEDPLGWYDGDGPAYNCAWYAQEDRCTVYGNSYANFGKTASEACCECK